MRHSPAGRRFVIVLVMFVAVAAACTSTDSSDASNSGQPSPTIIPSPSPSPTVPPKPKPARARVQGTYMITFVLIHSSVGGPQQKTTHNRWKITPKCKRGPCDVLVEAKGGKGGAKYTLRGLYVHGQYRFHRHVDAIWTCTIGSTTKNLDANFDYVFRPTKVLLVGGVWVASKLEGSLEEKGTSSCGFLPPPEERFLIRASRR
jgi:hypothetical protein